MVPGSTLRYGSILREATARPRAARMRPREAAVMPLPREEVTPPVTNTNFGNATTSGVFPILLRADISGHISPDPNEDSAAGRGAVGRYPVTAARFRSPPALRCGNQTAVPRA